MFYDDKKKPAYYEGRKSKCCLCVYFQCVCAPPAVNSCAVRSGVLWEILPLDLNGVKTKIIGRISALCSYKVGRNVTIMKRFFLVFRSDGCAVNTSY